MAFLDTTKLILTHHAIEQFRTRVNPNATKEDIIWYVKCAEYLKDKVIRKAMFTKDIGKTYYNKHANAIFIIQPHEVELSSFVIITVLNYKEIQKRVKESVGGKSLTDIKEITCPECNGTDNLVTWYGGLCPDCNKEFDILFKQRRYTIQEKRKPKII